MNPNEIVVVGSSNTDLIIRVPTAAGALLARGVQAVIITMGKRGANVATRKESRMIPGFKVRPVDTTAAGDVFMALSPSRWSSGSRSRKLCVLLSLLPRFPS